MTKDCFDGRSRAEEDGMIGLLETLRRSVFAFSSEGGSCLGAFAAIVFEAYC